MRESCRGVENVWIWQLLLAVNTTVRKGQNEPPSNKKPPHHTHQNMYGW